MATSFEPAFLESATAEALPNWLKAARQTQSGFAAGLPFAPADSVSQPGIADHENSEQIDALTLARQEGEAAGYAAAKAEFDAQFAQIDASFAKIEAEFAQQLSALLAEAVTALCEQTLAPLALDEAALITRCNAATEAVQSELSDAVLFLHPEDLTLVEAKLSDTISLAPDPQLQRGSIRLSTENSAILDGPQQWSAVIRRAIEQC